MNRSVIKGKDAPPVMETRLISLFCCFIVELLRGYVEEVCLCQRYLVYKPRPEMNLRKMQLSTWLPERMRVWPIGMVIPQQVLLLVRESFAAGACCPGRILNATF